MEIPHFGRRERSTTIAERLLQPPTRNKVAIIGIISAGAIYTAWNRMPPEARARAKAFPGDAYQRLTVVATALPETFSKVPEAISKIKELVPAKTKTPTEVG